MSKFYRTDVVRNPVTCFIMLSCFLALPVGCSSSLFSRHSVQSAASGIRSLVDLTSADCTSGNFICTPSDKIPNFGRSPTIESVSSGNFSDPAIWSKGMVPGVGDVVSISGGTTITYDVLSDTVIQTVSILSGGKLLYRTDVSTRLTLLNLVVQAGGELEIGTATGPIISSAKAELVFANQPLDTVNDPEQFGNGLIVLGKITTHGEVNPAPFIRLAAEPVAGQSTLSLSQPALGWHGGNKNGSS